MRFVLDLLYLLAGLAFSPIVIYRAIRHNRYRRGWAQRFGKVVRRSPAGKCIWLHAVSVGEVNAAKSIIEQLTRRFADIEIVVSTTTDTGFARASALFSEKHQVFYFPFDFSWVVRRAFGNIRPAVCLLMELEVWPNFIDTAHRLDVPVVVVNGRISDNSFSGYKRIRFFAGTIFRKITLILAQTDEYARRFREVGAVAENVVVTGSLKYDTAQITDKVDGTDALAAQLNICDERLWVAGATGPDEAGTAGGGSPAKNLTGIEVAKEGDLTRVSLRIDGSLAPAAALRPPWVLASETSMVLWRAKIHTSPTTTSRSVTVSFAPLAVSGRPVALASSGSSVVSQRPSASATAVFVWPAKATVTRSPLPVQPQMRAGFPRWRTMWSPRIRGRRSSAWAGAAAAARAATRVSADLTIQDSPRPSHPAT